MLRLLSETSGSLTRREWLRLATLGLGVSATGLRGARRAQGPGAGRAKSVLVVFTSGGQSQLDIWDLKPHAPSEIRGAFQPIRTSVPGTLLCEHLPQLSRLAHRFALIRSMSHDDVDHGSACYLSLTGHFHPRKSSNPPPRPTDAPALGAIVRRIHRSSRLPYAAVQLNGPLLVPDVVAPGQYGGFLGRAYEPLQLGDVREGVAELRGLEPRAELPLVRLDHRRSLLQAIEAYREQLLDSPAKELSIQRQQAYALLAQPACRSAFDLSREPMALRERYGLHRSGQACLLARRLVEAGVPFITVFFNPSIRGQDEAPHDTDVYGWDTHNDIFESLKDHLLPRFDQTFSVLLEDLQSRGLLDTTLVVCMGEFGRAPLVALEKTFAGTSPGRKHWAGCYSILLAGAGVTPGKVLGASDRLGAYPVTPAYDPSDVAATLFHALGYDPSSHYLDVLERPIRLAEGKVIQALYE